MYMDGTIPDSTPHIGDGTIPDGTPHIGDGTIPEIVLLI